MHRDVVYLCEMAQPCPPQHYSPRRRRKASSSSSSSAAADDLDFLAARSSSGEGERDGEGLCPPMYATGSPSENSPSESMYSRIAW